MVVCLLEDEEIDALGLGDEAALCRSHRIEYVGFPIKDRGVPPVVGEADRLSQTIASKVAGGASIAIHCRAGIGRSSVIAACVLIRLGCDPQSAFDRISKARGTPVPDTDEQREWIIGGGTARRAP
jgi:protein-tyrosine phosphatase